MRTINKLTSRRLIEERIGDIDGALRLRGVRRLHTRAVRFVNRISASQARSLNRDEKQLVYILVGQLMAIVSVSLSNLQEKVNVKLRDCHVTIEQERYVQLTRGLRYSREPGQYKITKDTYNTVNVPCQA